MLINYVIDDVQIVFAYQAAVQAELFLIAQQGIELHFFFNSNNLPLNSSDWKQVLQVFALVKDVNVGDVKCVAFDTNSTTMKFHES